jgi:phage terminase large subunit GpA-like protein
MCAAGYHQVAARVLTGADGHLRWYRATCGRCGDTFQIEEEGF